MRVHRPKADPVEWLSAAGTFLAAFAALVSVYGIVLDEVPPRVFEFVVAWWALGGVTMQIIAGFIGRQRAGARVAQRATIKIRRKKTIELQSRHC